MVSEVDYSESTQIEMKQSYSNGDDAVRYERK